MCFNRFFKRKYKPSPIQFEIYSDGIRINHWSFRISNIPKNLKRSTAFVLSASFSFIEKAQAFTTTYFYDPSQSSLYKFDVNEKHSKASQLMSIPASCNATIYTKPVTEIFTPIHVVNECVAKGPQSGCFLETEAILYRSISSLKQSFEDTCLIPKMDKLFEPNTEVWKIVGYVVASMTACGLIVYGTKKLIDCKNNAVSYEQVQNASGVGEIELNINNTTSTYQGAL